MQSSSRWHWCKKGALNSDVNQHIGTSRGGNNTKIHAIVDALGNPIHIQLTAGNTHDVRVAAEALNCVNINESTVLADKAYGSKSLRTYIESCDATYCIPPKSNQSDQWEYDLEQYKERHLVECFFQKLKKYRRIATRYEKLVHRFLAIVYLACAFIWLK